MYQGTSAVRPPYLLFLLFQGRFAYIYARTDIFLDSSLVMVHIIRYGVNIGYSIPGSIPFGVASTLSFPPPSPPPRYTCALPPPPRPDTHARTQRHIIKWYGHCGPSLLLFMVVLSGMEFFLSADACNRFFVHCLVPSTLHHTQTRHTHANGRMANPSPIPYVSG